ncbi:MAG: superoxide dismutase, Ni [Kiritimatiellales bacterium]|nr:superoxide dismutase, Ni [Kiritimatiellales bacterium]
MNKVARYSTIMVLFAAMATATVRAHCQMPCGIYDDQMRIHLMEEQISVIEKAMTQIETEKSQNQIVRWVMTKDKQADDFSEIVTAYFMAQRIKPGCDDYALKLSQLHEMVIYAMKAKQTTDLANVEKLKELVHAFEHSYMGAEHKH